MANVLSISSSLLCFQSEDFADWVKIGCMYRVQW